MQLYGMDAGSVDRILTTHVGSLIRPSELIFFHEKKLNDEPYEQAAYDACLKDAVADVVRQQAEIGIDIVSDGEFGKNVSWSRYVLERLSASRKGQAASDRSKRRRGRTVATLPSFTPNLKPRRASSAWANHSPKPGSFIRSDRSNTPGKS
jgi:5-methyltetrahydropteroyltriglutamate--homocysteine methyltransferase